MAVLMQSRVAKGVELLNRVLPDWAYAVNLNTLNMADDIGSPAGDGCILCHIGRVHGDANSLRAGATRIGIRIREISIYGFGIYEVERGLTLQETDKAYSKLTKLWIAAIKANRPTKNRPSQNPRKRRRYSD